MSSTAVKAPALPKPPAPPSLDALPKPPAPPHIRFGRPGKLGGLRFGRPEPVRPPKPPRLPRVPSPSAQHEASHQQQATPAPTIVHIHQDMPPVQQPTPREPKPSKASAAREHLRAVMGPQISQRTEGMDAEGMRLLQTHTRAHGRKAVKEYHGAGKDRLRFLIAQAKATPQSVPAGGIKQGEYPAHQASVNAAVAKGQASGKKFVRTDLGEGMDA